MPATLQQLITDTRSRLDEVITYPAASPPGSDLTQGRFWKDNELVTWINEAARDIARRTETIQNFRSELWTTAGQAKYGMPRDMIRIHRVEFVPSGSNTIYMVTASTYQELDQYWGITPQTQRSYPYFYCLWGFPPNVTMQLYPVPSQAGVLNIYYYRLPATMANPTDIAEIPEGWHDLIPLYCEYVAKRKARDPLWKDAQQLYENSIQMMLDVTRQWHDQSRSITVGTSAIPEWLYGGMEW